MSPQLRHQLRLHGQLPDPARHNADRTVRCPAHCRTGWTFLAVVPSAGPPPAAQLGTPGSPSLRSASLALAPPTRHLRHHPYRGSGQCQPRYLLTTSYVACSWFRAA